MKSRASHDTNAQELATPISKKVTKIKLDISLLVCHENKISQVVKRRGKDATA